MGGRYRRSVGQCSVDKPHDGRTCPAAKFISGSEPFYKLGLSQNASNDLSLDANSLSVDDADDRESFLACFFEVRDGDGLNVLWREGVKVDRVRYLELDRFWKWIVWFVVRSS